jgi:hypothetical protein
MSEKKPPEPPEDFMARWQREQEKRRETRRAELTQLLSTCPELALLEVEYNGSDDNGQIEELTAYDHNNNPLPLHDNFRVVVENFVYDLLEVHCSGWEINAGSSGLVTIDARTLQGTIEHDWVVTHTQTHEIEF